MNIRMDAVSIRPQSNKYTSVNGIQFTEHYEDVSFIWLLRVSYNAAFTTA